MTLTLLSAGGMPAYIATSSDVSGSSCPGASLIGKIIYTKDDQKWYIVVSSGCVASYVLPT